MKRKAVFEVTIDVDKSANSAFEHLSKMITGLSGSSTGAHKGDTYIFKVDEVKRVE